MARRSEHSQEEIREMVLNAAEVIVTQEGFSALKVRNIAMEIGYTVGSVYMVFDNLDDLVMHTKVRTLDKLAVQLQQAVQGDDAEQDLAALAKAYLGFANEHFNLWNMIFTHRLPEHVALPDWYQSRVDDLFSKVGELFSKLKPEQSPREIKLAARALWSGIHGICILSLNGKLDAVGVKDVENSVILLVDCFIRGWVYKSVGLEHMP